MMSEIPQELTPPAGEELVLKAHAIGFQIYVCEPDSSGTSWALKAPEAKLIDETGAVVGSHFAGPTWRLADGSQIKATLTARVDAPDANAIPWLLLTVTGREGNGGLSRITSIQRIHTSGGKSPATPGTPGQEAKTSYSADYYFYARVT